MSKVADNRGEETRELILSAALDLFGEFGYDGTSTRMIAAKAKANVAAIGYHFGGKEELYKAVMMSIMQGGDKYLGEFLEESSQYFDKVSKVSKAKSFEMLDALTNRLAEMFVESQESKSWAKLIIREQANPSSVFNILYENKIKPLQQIYCKLVSSVLGLSESNIEVKIISHSLFGQVLAFVVSRESFLRMIGVKSLSDRHIKLVKKILSRNNKYCLRR